jgi:hypothetical protein
MLGTGNAFLAESGPVGLLKNSLFAFFALFPSTANEQK